MLGRCSLSCVALNRQPPPQKNKQQTAFGTTERELLRHIYAAMDEHDAGYVSFRQFVCALSTVFRCVRGP